MPAVYAVRTFLFYAVCAARAAVSVHVTTPAADATRDGGYIEHTRRLGAVGGGERGTGALQTATCR